MINSKGGTGGGAFRNMYSQFLIESSVIVENKRLENYGKDFKELGYLWENIAEELMELYNTGKDNILTKLSPMILGVWEKETNLYRSMKIEL